MRRFFFHYQIRIITICLQLMALLLSFSAMPSERTYLDVPREIFTLSCHGGEQVLGIKPLVKLSPQIRHRKHHPLILAKEEPQLSYVLNERLAIKEELRQSSRVLGTNDGRQYLTQQEAIHIAGESNHSLWGIYRTMTEFTHNNKTMVALRLVATAERVASQEQFTTLAVRHLTQEIRVNDIALAEEKKGPLHLTTFFSQHPAPHGIQAHILASLEGMQYTAKNHVVVIDHGAVDGLVAGNFLELYQAGTKLYQANGQFPYPSQPNSGSFTSPPRKVGRLMVLKPYETVSLALITRSDVPIDSSVLALSPAEETAFPCLPVC